MSRVVRADLRIALSATRVRGRDTRCRLRLGRGYPRKDSTVSGRYLATSIPTLMAQKNGLSVPLKDQAPGDAETASSGTEAPSDNLAIVFTDIVKSTYLWEHELDAMNQAIEQHDNTLRSLLIKHDGYEVKQNGDGFMIAFQSAVAALEFCLEVQEQLLEIEWPEELLELDAGSEVLAKHGAGSDHEEEVVFKGLRLRISCHWGEPVSKWNETISRMDYLGPVVNVAARFIQATEGGQIVVSEAFLEALGKSKNASENGPSEGPLFAATAEMSVNEPNSTGAQVNLKNLKAEHAESALKDKRFEVRSLGKRHFKGVSDDQNIFFFIPHSLHGRLQFWPKHMQIEGSKGNLSDSGG